MPLKQTQIIDEIKKLVHLLGKNNIHIQQAFLFGSYAKGSAKEWSDIDVALVSDDFSGIRFYDRNKLNSFLGARDFDTLLEIHPFKSEDFKEGRLFAEEILRHGIRIV